MKLFEYQAKQIFAANKIEIPDGILVDNEKDLQTALNKIGFPCALKAQVLSGGRGKRGLVKIASTDKEAIEIFLHIRKEAGESTKILVEKGIHVFREIYVAILPDSQTGETLLMAAGEGGVDIEQLSKSSPEKIIEVRIAPEKGMQQYQLRQLSFRLQIGADYSTMFEQTVSALYNVFCNFDAEMAEINPLFLTEDGKVIAGDAKLLIDDNSLYRHPDVPRTQETTGTPAEYLAAQEGIPYLQFDGDIGLLCTGAGITNMTLDLINADGGKASNYLEFGGPHYRKAELALRLCLMSNPKVILVVTFGTIARSDVIAKGIIDAMAKLKCDLPLVTCIRGTNEEEAAIILKEANIPAYQDVEEAVAKAVELAAERSKK